MPYMSFKKNLIIAIIYLSCKLELIDWEWTHLNWNIWYLFKLCHQDCALVLEAAFKMRQMKMIIKKIVPYLNTNVVQMVLHQLKCAFYFASCKRV